MLVTLGWQEYYDSIIPSPFIVRSPLYFVCFPFVCKDDNPVLDVLLNLEKGMNLRLEFVIVVPPALEVVLRGETL